MANSTCVTRAALRNLIPAPETTLNQFNLCDGQSNSLRSGSDIL
jgi:hypothetical protein